MKRLFVDEFNQQPLVNTTMLLMDFGLGILLVLTAVLMGWRLYDLFLKNGQWNKEFKNEIRTNAEAELEEQKRKMEELKATLEEISQ